MMLNPEESIPKDEPMEERDEAPGYSVVMNCYQDGRHDVFTKPLEPATEAEYPDGIFGLESVEDALKAVIALKQNGPDYSSAEDEGMMQGYGAGKASEDEELAG